MMNWLYYLLEANLYLILFYGFYRVFLHKETFYATNRYFLILSSLTAFIIPLLQLGFLSKEIILSNASMSPQVEVEKPALSVEKILIVLYLLVVFLFILKMIWGFRHIFTLLKSPNKIVENGIVIIELANTKTAFSFFNMLFIDPELPQKNTILKHEMAHIKQKHSFDVLFFEMIRSLNWFNPMTYLMKNDVKLLHEYLADEETTNKGIEKYDYAIFLIQNSYRDQSVQFTNPIFNSSILKRRISMLNQKKSAKWARLRLLLLLPVVAGMLCASTMAFTKDYGIVDLYPKQEKAVEVIIQEPTKKTTTKKPVPPPPPAEPTKLKLQKVAPPPPPIEPAPKAKSPKKANKNIAPPPPPVEPAPKPEVLEIRLTPPPPPAEPVPAKKKYDKDDVIYGDPTPSEKISGQIKDAITKEIKAARVKQANSNK